MRPPHPVGRAGAKAGTVRGGERGGDLTLPRPAQPRSAANTPNTAITIPSAIFAAAAAARPTTAPHPARTAVPVVRDSEYSNSAAPANQPRNAPITLPTIGTGTRSEERRVGKECKARSHAYEQKQKHSGRQHRDEM